jgi:Transposase DNA-binding
MMARTPEQSLPKQAGGWPDLKAAYRLLSSDRVEPTAIGAAHRGQVWRESMKHPVVLCVQDQRWFERPTPAVGETRLQRMARCRESCVWSDAAEALGKAEGGCRLIHVSDRASDDLNFMDTCQRQGHGFVIRARHDRRVEDARDKLWSRMTSAPVLGTLTVQVGEQRAGGRVTRRGRKAVVTIRVASVTLDPPWNHPTPGTARASRTVQAIYLREPDPPKDAKAIDWMLLTGEPAEPRRSSRRWSRFYRCMRVLTTRNAPWFAWTNSPSS